jgi:hypothetical protein
MARLLRTDRLDGSIRMDLRMNVSGNPGALRLPWLRRGVGGEPIIGEARDRQRRRRRRMLLIALLLVVAVAVSYGGFRLGGGGSAGLGRLAAASARPAELPRQPGWYVGHARVASPGCSHCVQTASWASTIPYRDKANDFPQRTMVVLGTHDVIVMITRAWQPHTLAWMLTRRPLRITPGRIQTNFEGNPTNGRVSQWQTATWLNGSFVTVYVFFGSDHPTRADVGRAQRELAATSFPRWKVKSG